MNRKFIVLVAILLAAAGLYCAFGYCGKTAAPKIEKIVVGLDDSFPPMGFKNEQNEIVGFDIDIAKEVAKRLSVPVEFKAIDWSSKEAELSSGRIDCIWNGLDITPEREKNMLFSDPYMNNRQLLFVRIDSSVKDFADLAGKTVGLQNASTADDNMEKQPEFKKTVTVKKYTDYIEAFIDLENGRLDGVFADEIVGRYYMRKRPGKFVCIDKAFGPLAQFGIAFRKGNEALRNLMQSKIDEVTADGTGAKISEKWFGADLLIKK